jgi:hypothetical protein
MTLFSLGVPEPSPGHGPELLWILGTVAVLGIARHHLRKKREELGIQVPALAAGPQRFQFSLSELLFFIVGSGLMLRAVVLPPFLEDEMGISDPFLLGFSVISIAVGLAWHLAWLRWARAVTAEKARIAASPKAQSGEATKSQ